MQAENRPQILIRKAISTDAQRIAVLCHLLGYPTSEQKVHERLKLLGNKQEHIVYVAYLLDEPVIGWIHVHVLQSVMLDSRAVILGLIVNPDYRGCGAGHLLIQHAQQWAKEQGCDTILVRSNIVRQQAHQFYEKVGYIPFKTQLVLHKDLNEISFANN